MKFKKKNIGNAIRNTELLVISYKKRMLKKNQTTFWYYNYYIIVSIKTNIYL